MSKIKFAVIKYSKFLDSIPALVNDRGVALIYLPGNGHITLNRNEYEILRMADAEILDSDTETMVFYTGDPQVNTKLINGKILPIKEA
jgi:hypothetical protein